MDRAKVISIWMEQNNDQDKVCLLCLCNKYIAPRASYLYVITDIIFMLKHLHQGPTVSHLLGHVRGFLTQVKEDILKMQ